jgi:uncharacterized protein (TIGR01244 family)
MNPRVMPRSFLLSVVFGLLVFSFFSVAAPIDESISGADPKRITVGPQIYVDQLLKLKRQGFSVIINNRPDGEERAQPSSKKIQLEAEYLGLDFFHIPVSTLGINKENTEALVQALASTSGPVFAFCRSGARSKKLKNSLPKL